MTDNSSINLQGSKLANLMLLRGHLIYKESRQFPTLKVDMRQEIWIHTICMIVAKSARVVAGTQEKSYGISFTVFSEDGYGTNHVDFDELHELLAAIKYLSKLSAKFAQEQRDLTEVDYITRDGFQVTLCQDSSEEISRRANYNVVGESIDPQKVYIRAGRVRCACKVADLEQLAIRIADAREHLISKGAGQLSNASQEADGTS